MFAAIAAGLIQAKTASAVRHAAAAIAVASAATRHASLSAVGAALNLARLTSATPDVKLIVLSAHPEDFETNEDPCSRADADAINPTVNAFDARANEYVLKMSSLSYNWEIKFSTPTPISAGTKK